MKEWHWNEERVTKDIKGDSLTKKKNTRHTLEICHFCKQNHTSSDCPSLDVKIETLKTCHQNYTSSVVPSNYDLPKNALENSSDNEQIGYETEDEDGITWRITSISKENQLNWTEVQPEYAGYETEHME